jgi:hypothetical protein
MKGAIHVMQMPCMMVGYGALCDVKAPKLHANILKICVKIQLGR